MSEIKKIFFAALVFFGTFFSLSAEGAPVWVSRPSKAYSDKLYFAAVGSSKDKSTAEVIAINNLCSVFGQSVKSDTLSSKKIQESVSESSFSQNVLRLVNHENLIAVEIAETWNDTAKKTWYALAVMDKSKAFSIYKSIIEDNYTVIARLKNDAAAAKHKDNIQLYAELYKASVLAGENEVYYNRLKVINVKEASSVYKNELAPSVINKLMKEAAYQIPVCISIEGDTDGTVAKAFSEVLADYGFNTASGSNEKYIIKGSVNFTETVGNNGSTYYCEYTANFDFKDTAAGEDLVPFSVTGREGSPSKANAQKRSVKKINDKVKADFKPQFEKFLTQFS